VLLAALAFGECQIAARGHKLFDNRIVRGPCQPRAEAGVRFAGNAALCPRQAVSTDLILLQINDPREAPQWKENPGNPEAL
jgi:hypothetical protein